MTRLRRPAVRAHTMPRARTATAVVAVGAVLALGLSTPSSAEPSAAAVAAPGDYCVGQCADIVPPGQNGNATFTDLLLFKGFGTRPPHFSDTVKPYERLVWNSQGITDDGLDPYFDDSSFGVKPGDVASTFKPRADVTIVRDKSRGIPHITGTTREGTMFGAGHAGAQDRLFVMDVFRHLGRGQLTPFAGGAAGNRAFEQEFWRTAPYNEVDLQKQFDDADELYGANGLKMQKDIQAWVDGVNHYINTVGIAYPGEYVALGLPTPRPWKVTDVVATAAVVAADLRDRWWRRDGVGAGLARGTGEVRCCSGHQSLGGVPVAERPGGQHHRAQRRDLPLWRCRRQPGRSRDAGSRLGDS